MSSQAGLAGFNVHADPSGLWKKAEMDYRYKKDLQDSMERKQVRAAEERKSREQEAKANAQKQEQEAKAKELWNAYMGTDPNSPVSAGFIGAAQEQGIDPEVAAQTIKNAGVDLGLSGDDMASHVRNALGTITPPDMSSSLPPPEEKQGGKGAKGQKSAPPQQANARQGGKGAKGQKGGGMGMGAGGGAAGGNPWAGAITGLLSAFGG